MCARSSALWLLSVWKLGWRRGQETAAKFPILFLFPKKHSLNSHVQSHRHTREHRYIQTDMQKHMHSHTRTQRCRDTNTTTHTHIQLHRHADIPVYSYIPDIHRNAHPPLHENDPIIGSEVVSSHKVQAFIFLMTENKVVPTDQRSFLLWCA